MSIDLGALRKILTLEIGEGRKIATPTTSLHRFLERRKTYVLPRILTREKSVKKGGATFLTLPGCSGTDFSAPGSPAGEARGLNP